MHGLIVRLIVAAGKRDEVVRMLRESAADMPGCLSYIVAADSSDEDAIWVTEVWDSVASHDDSLSLPSVKNAIPQVKPLISNFTKIAVTTPVWGVGLQSTRVT
jgi:quinol monooxygenase YgiN